MKSNKKASINFDIKNINGENRSSGVLIDQYEEISKYQRLLIQTVRVYLSNQRSGTASTKTRGMVRGSTRKIYRQKGTGKARHGDIKAPIFVGGGIVFGPHQRSYNLKLNKKMKRKSMTLSIIDKLRSQKIIVIDDFSSIELKTKAIFNFLNKVIKNDFLKQRVLLVNDKNKKLTMAARNIPNLTITSPVSLNAYSILTSTFIIIELGVFEKLILSLGIEKQPKKLKK